MALLSKQLQTVGRAAVISRPHIFTNSSLPPIISVSSSRTFRWRIDVILIDFLRHHRPKIKTLGTFFSDGTEDQTMFKGTASLVD